MDEAVLVKDSVKRAQQLNTVGRHRLALSLLQSAFHLTQQDFADNTQVSHYLPRLHHRMGETHALLGHSVMACGHFQGAEDCFDPDNVVGRGINLRDHAWMHYCQGNEMKWSRLIRQAMDLLQQPSTSTPQVEQEFIVTDGFIARTTADTEPEDARRRLEAVDEAVRGGNLWIYELENLLYLKQLVRLWERPRLEIRTRELSTRIFVVNEALIAGDRAMEGDPIGAVVDLGVQTAKRLLPFT